MSSRQSKYKSITKIKYLNDTQLTSERQDSHKGLHEMQGNRKSAEDAIESLEEARMNERLTEFKHQPKIIDEG
jgi:hypothetical protein